MNGTTCEMPKLAAKYTTKRRTTTGESRMSCRAARNSARTVPVTAATRRSSRTTSVSTTPMVAERQAEPLARRDIGEQRQHDPGVAEDKAAEQPRHRQHPDVGTERRDGEQHALDVGGAHDDELTGIAVCPDAPERQQRQADDELE